MVAEWLRCSSAHPLRFRALYVKTTPELIAYFDEAGDPGVRAVAPIDPNGASEWFSLSCVVIRAAREVEPVAFIKRIKDQIKSNQRPDLHYRHLSERNKSLVCGELAKENVRAFVLVSNKKNMRNYRNEEAEALAVHKFGWFYNYCIRLLLERVTDWCRHKSMIEHGEPRPLRLVFSRRGGHSYRHVQTYIELLSIQASNNRIFQDVRIPKFDTVHHDLIEVIQHDQNAGCQLADVVASAFYQAAHTAQPKKWNTAHAEALMPRMAMIGNRHAKQGVTLLPWKAEQAELTDDQKKIFRFYGYRL